MSNATTSGETAADAVRLPITDELDLHTFRPSDLGELLPAYFAECRARGLDPDAPGPALEEVRQLVQDGNTLGIDISSSTVWRSCVWLKASRFSTAITTP